MKNCLYLLLIISYHKMFSQDLVLKIDNLPTGVNLQSGNSVLAAKSSINKTSLKKLILANNTNSNITVRIKNNATSDTAIDLSLLKSDTFSINVTQGGNPLLIDSVTISIFKKGQQTASFRKKYFFTGANDFLPDPDHTPKKATGIPFYDAQSLSYHGTINFSQKAEIIQILAFYKKKSGEVSWQDIKDLYKDNKLILEYLDTLQELKENEVRQVASGGTTNVAASSGFSLSSLGGLDVTKIADGFAKFIVKRTKQELTIAFFEKFKALLASDDYRDLHTVFPETYQALTIIGDEVYNYQAYIQTLRESFEKDLATLTGNLPTIIDNHHLFFDPRPYLSATLKSGCYIAENLRDKKHPGDILQDYPAEFLDSLNVNWKGAFQTLQLLSASLRDTSANTDSVYWVGAKKIRQLVKNTTTLKIYLGLLYEEAKTFNDGLPIAFKNNVTFNGLLDSVALNYNSLSGFITGFGDKVEKLSTVIKNYTKTTSDSMAIAQYYSYFTASIDLLQQCTQITTVPKFKNILNADLKKDMTEYFEVARSASDIVLNVSKRNYSAAVVDAVHIYDLVRVKHDSGTAASTTLLSSRKVAKKVNQVNKTLDSISVRTIALADQLKNNPGDNAAIAKIDALTAAVNSLNTNIASIPDSGRNTNVQKVKNALFKYGSFMAAIVQAKTSDDVESTIEAFALPTGSARIKRETLFNVAINAYAGLYIGHESIEGISNKHTFNSYGVTAPIGISISRGHSIFFVGTGEQNWIKGKRAWSTSLFISLIDLGAVAAYRFKDDTTAQIPTIQLKNIFSPGAFISLGIPKTPLSINMGAQMGPNLRKVYGLTGTQESNDYENKIYWRYSLSVCVDIPVLNLYTKSR